MPSHERESHPTEERGSLELNKETLQDLNLEESDVEHVKGGATVDGGPAWPRKSFVASAPMLLSTA